jgi:3-hydroxyacyl-CoA dehydrogenase
MASDRPIRRVAIVGTGAVGARWAAFYLARGFDVIATDPERGAEASLRQAIDTAWPALKALGISPQGSPEHLCFKPNLAAAVSEADFIQECGPEDQDRKIELVAEIDRSARPTPSSLQARQAWRSAQYSRPAGIRSAASRRTPWILRT